MGVKVRVVSCVRVARRPKWIAALFLALGVASIFGLLGQWQLDRSIEQGTIIERNTEP